METFIKKHLDKIPLFSGVDHDELALLMKDCSVQSLKSGEFIYKHGDYGDDCGVVLSGSMRVELRQGPDKADKMVLLKEGDIFGEMAALSGYVRTADVAAAEPAEILVISKGTLLHLFDKFPAVKDRIDILYRERVLRHQLTSAPLFMGLPENVIEQLAEKAVLHSCVPGDIVVHQGDDADAFYMVRYGFVKVTESGPDGLVKVLAYLKGGHYFGEMALVHEGEKRMATVTAIDRTELVSISAQDFQQIMEAYPRVRTSLENAIEKIKEKNVRLREDEYLEKAMSAVIDSGFVRSSEVLVIDFTKCVQCNSCINACRTLHDNESRLVRKGIRLNNILLIATSCRHCDDPACMIKCPTGAINRGTAGEIYYNDACIGCGRCARNCQYDNITMVAAGADGKENSRGFFSRWRNKESNALSDEEKGMDKKRRPKRKPVKCDMCREYPFMACVYNCPTGAARRIDPAEFMADVMGTG